MNGKKCIFSNGGALTAASCGLFASISDDDDEEESSVTITALSLAKTALALKAGGMDYIAVTVTPRSVQKDVKLSWSYDKSIIECDTSSSWGVTIKGLAEGQTLLRCSYGGYDATCLVTVSGFEEGYETTTEPYIYSNTTILQTALGVTEKVFVSLYGGDASDIDGYTWTLDNASVAQIQPTGQYCLITAKDSGYTRIKVTHTKAAYPYYIGVYVFADATKVTYITTENNILTMNKDDDEQTIIVSLVNGSDEAREADFAWSLVDENGAPLAASNAPIGVETNGNKAIITPKASGSCTLRVTHPDAIYPLDILCRVITVVKNVYIQPDSTVVYLDGNSEQTVTATLKNIAESEYRSDDYTYTLDNYDTAEIVSYIGNQVLLRGKANGSTKLLISHPKAAYDREVLIVVREQLSDAVDASCMLTTTQNYIKTKVGAEETRLSVSLKGGSEEDSQHFTWNVQEQPNDGASRVIELVTTDGAVSNARMAAQTFAYGTAYIKPLSVGSATITVTNSKSYYPLEILVNVLDASAVLEEQYYFTGEGIVKFLNSETYDYTATLRGAPESAKGAISWESDSQTLVINASGEKAALSSTATGNAVSHITVRHPSAQSPKEVLVLNADTQEALDAMKAFYANKTYYSVNVEATVNIYANQVGFTDENGDELDFSTVKSQVQWTSSDPLIASVERSGDEPLTGVVTGNKAGTAKITLSYNSVSATFTVTVYPKGVVIGEVEKTVYLTTAQNVLILGTEETKTASITAVGLPSSKYSDIRWEVKDASIASVVGNGNSATITGLSEGETEITVSHPDSENMLKLYARVGSEYVLPEKAVVPYITAPNVITMLTKDASKSLTATLSNFSGTSTSGFQFSIDNERTATIAAQSTNGTAYLQPVAAGSAEVTISHTSIEAQKKVLVVVGDTIEAINEILENKVYLTTKNNVVSLESEGAAAEVSISAVNLSASEYHNIQWTSTNNAVASVVANGTSATITAAGEGKACVSVTHENSLNAVTFYVYVGKTAIEEANGGSASGNASSGTSSQNDTSQKESVISISSANVLTLSLSGSDKQLSATLSGYTGSDTEGFSFAIADERIANIASQSVNGTAYIKPVAAGYTEITISHKATSVTKKVLVVVAKTEEAATETLQQLVYLTTTKNVLFLDENGRGSLSLSANNLATSASGSIRWTCSTAAVATVIGNGTTATVIAHGAGMATVTATHPESKNALEFFVYVGKTALQAPEAPEGSPAPVYIASDDELSLMKGDQSQKIHAVLVNYTGADTDGFRFAIDNEAVATISAQSTNGTAYVKPLSSGQAEITISHTATKLTKKVLVVVGNSAEELSGTTYLTTSTNVVAISEGNTKSVSVQVKNAADVVLDGYSWQSSNPAVVDVTSGGATAVLTGNGIGTAIITVTNKSCRYPLQIIAQCVDPIAASASPYIQLSSSVMTVTVGSGYQSVTAELVGGSEADVNDFVWQSGNQSIAAVYAQNGVGKIRALSAGQTYVTVSHPKASYKAQLLVVCDEATKSECYISVPSSIVTMKPTDGAQTIQATLINGTATDKYSFGWSLDVYDIIDFQYSANVCTITPKQTGSVTITVSHPKAAFSQQIIVNVQQYSTFAFPSESMTITQGDVRFLSMQVPTTNVATHIEYFVGDPKQNKKQDKILTVQGTKTTAQITAVASGTTTVTAKLVATSTGVVQATAEMMVYVKEKEVDAVYITSASTITTVNKGKSQTLSATLSGTGVTTSDQQSLKWTTSDSDIVQVTGIGRDGTITGQSIYITALKSGEAVITCSHEKAASSLQFYVVVPGTAEQTVTINKSFVTVMKGSAGTTLKATIQNLEQNSDYNNLVWSISGVNGAETVRLMGTTGDDGTSIVGQSVQVYPLSVGEATVMAQLSNGAKASCTVKVEANKSLVFETSSKKVQPNRTKTVKYTVSPANAILTWTTAQQEEFFEFSDNKCDANGNGSIDIIGLKEGNGTLTCITDGGAKATLSVRVSWDYQFSISGATSFSIKPSETRELSYTVNPADAAITVESTGLDSKLFTYDMIKGAPTADGYGTGKIVIKPLTENKEEFDITIKATNRVDEKDEDVGSETIRAKFLYEKDDIQVNISKVTSDGVFSQWNNTSGVLTLGDGETVRLKVAITTPKTAARFSSGVNFSSTNGVSANVATVTGTQKQEVDTGKVLYIDVKHEKDVSRMQYRIKKAFVPMIGEKAIANWETRFDWYLNHCSHSGEDCDNSLQLRYLDANGSNGNQCLKYSAITDKTALYMAICTRWYGGGGHDEGTYDSSSSKFNPLKNLDTAKYNDVMYGIKEDASLCGRIYPADEFEKIAWFYCPGTRPDALNGNTAKLTIGHVSTDWRCVCHSDNPLKGVSCDYNDLCVDKCVITKHVEADYEVSTDNTILLKYDGYTSGSCNNISVPMSIAAEPYTYTVYIPVNLEVRTCAKTYSGK